MKYVLPEKLVSVSGSLNAKTLLRKKEDQILLTESDLAVFEAGGHIVLDFGKEYAGGIRILTHFKAGRVRIRFGESLTEANSDVGVFGATNDHAIRDFETPLAFLSDATLGNTGFRFVRIDFYEETEVKSIYAAAVSYNGKPIYEYKGDKDIERIFLTAKRTVDLCASGRYVWDGIKRDRLVWFGDLHPETIALSSVYGKCQNVENSLNLARKTTPIGEWMNTFPSYSMWWITTVYDYMRLSGRTEFAKKQLPYMKRLINEFDKNVSDDGEMLFNSYFTDWQTHDTPQEKEGVRAIFIIAVNSAKKLFGFFGEDTKIADKILGKLLKKEINTGDKKQIIALKYLATGKLTESDRKTLLTGGAKGISTFMSYYILTAIASFDKIAAVDIMKEYYGAMLDKGATTFWEDFDIDWVKNSCRIDETPTDGEKDLHADFGAYCYKGLRHSLCHGWSAGVIAFIKENLS